MKNNFSAALLLAFLLCQSLWAQQGKVVESKSFKSLILNREVKYSLYLPPGYETSQRRYPVVYLLHGYSDNETGWVQFGAADFAADKAINAGEITPLIIVMPDGGLSWYINDYQNKNKWGDMFIKELIPHIDATLRTRATKEYRAIAGLSMGGYGSLINSLKNLNTFSACAALSAAVWTDKEVELRRNDYENPWWPKTATGKDRLTKHWKDNSTIELVNNLPLDSLKKVRWYIDCGDKDFLTVGNAQLHIAMTEKMLPHEYRSRNGVHNWEYWRIGITDALKFITIGFDRR